MHVHEQSSRSVDFAIALVDAQYPTILERLVHGRPLSVRRSADICITCTTISKDHSSSTGGEAIPLSSSLASSEELSVHAFRLQILPLSRFMLRPRCGMVFSSTFWTLVDHHQCHFHRPTNAMSYYSDEFVITRITKQEYRDAGQPRTSNVRGKWFLKATGPLPGSKPHYYDTLQSFIRDYPGFGGASRYSKALPKPGSRITGQEFRKKQDSSPVRSTHSGQAGRAGGTGNIDNIDDQSEPGTTSRESSPRSPGLQFRDTAIESDGTSGTLHREYGGTPAVTEPKCTLFGLIPSLKNPLLPSDALASADPTWAYYHASHTKLRALLGLPQEMPLPKSEGESMISSIRGRHSQDASEASLVQTRYLLVCRTEAPDHYDPNYVRECLPKINTTVVCEMDYLPESLEQLGGGFEDLSTPEADYNYWSIRHREPEPRAKRPAEVATRGKRRRNKDHAED